MLKLGITGSIATGKTTVATMVRKLGFPVADSDRIVAKVYRLEAGRVARALAEHGDFLEGGQISKARLRQKIERDPDFIKILEEVVHPLVGEWQRAFFKQAQSYGFPLAGADIPLLLESNNRTRFDAIAVIRTTLEIQRSRLEKRKSPTNSRLTNILSERQIDTATKLTHADFVIDGDEDLAHTYQQVSAMIEKLLQPSA